MYRVTLRNHFLLLKESLALIITFLIVVLIILAMPNPFASVVFCTLIFVIFFSPTIILHFTYYLQAKDMQIEFTEDGLKVTDGNGLKTIRDEDIIRIEMHMSPSLAERGYATGKYPGEDYYYAMIVTHSDEIIINNLIYPDLLNIDRYLNLSKFKYITRLFAFLPEN